MKVSRIDVVCKNVDWEAEKSLRAFLKGLGFENTAGSADVGNPNENEVKFQFEKKKQVYEGLSANDDIRVKAMQEVIFDSPAGTKIECVLDNGWHIEMRR